MVHKELILILDFGSQYTQLIARRVRECGVYSEIHPYNIDIAKIKLIKPAGIILSGGPLSVYDKDAPRLDNEIFKLNIPILGICYGLQLICLQLGGSVKQANSREYGKATFNISGYSSLLQNINPVSVVWMSHGDYVTGIPYGFNIIGTSDNSPFSAIANEAQNIFGVQFHPEVAHTEEGIKILKNFLFKICKAQGEWTPKHFIDSSIDNIRNLVRRKKAICALSGGVD